MVNHPSFGYIPENVMKAAQCAPFGQAKGILEPYKKQAAAIKRAEAKAEKKAVKNG